MHAKHSDTRAMYAQGRPCIEGTKRFHTLELNRFLVVFGLSVMVCCEKSDCFSQINTFGVEALQHCNGLGTLGLYVGERHA